MACPFDPGAHPVTTADAMRIGPTGTDHVTPMFIDRLATLERPSVLELGTHRWQGDLPTHHLEWVPQPACYVMSDITKGPDVDVVADAHDLAPFADGAFDAVIAVSVWEHLARPWLAALQVARVLRPGGVAYIATHHCFPIHGYPDDYTRWTTAGLAVLFEDAGLGTVASGYCYPCRIDPGPDVTRWNPDAPAFLNVQGIWEKPC